MEQYSNESELHKEKTINELFEEQVARTPESKALIFKDKVMTYRQLNEKSEQLAKLLRAKNIGADRIVGIMTRRSMEMIVAIFAVLKAGGAYLPIDPDYPEERVQYMLQDSGADIILTQKGLINKIEFLGEKIDIEDEVNYYSPDIHLPATRNKSDNLAYVIYTSGSTGNPKGVMIEHKAVFNFIKGVTDLIDFAEYKTILALTTISFDIFGLETMLPLVNGLKVVIADENEQKNPRLLSELISNNKIDMLQITPSRMQLLLGYEKGLHCLRNLKEVMIGGEALPESLLERIKLLTEAKIYNMYGPTETTIWSTIGYLTESEKVDIGKPIANTQIFIVDENNELLPPGSEGELCIAGGGLARGYLNRPELTAEKFVPNPFIKGERMYKTGDIAKWLPDGNIECLGRIDNQVKIRGFRVETSEIEAILRRHETVKDVLVAAKESKDQSKYLCAYIVSDKELMIQELKEFLQKKMPEYMVPAHFIRLYQLPLTPNGKIDRKALPSPDEVRLQSTEQMNISNASIELEAKDEYDLKIKSIFKEVAGLNMAVEEIDKLGQLALDSIVNMKVMIAIEMEFDMEFPIEALAPDRFATIRELAEYIHSIN